MKRLLAILLLFANTAQAANEIRAFCPGVTNAYAMVREIDGDVWYISGQVFEAWGTGGRTAADYDIAMVDKSGDMFVGDMDTNIAAGTYYVTTSSRVGAAPADTDPVMWYDYIQWSGSAVAEPTPGGIADAVWDEAVADHTTETSFGGEVGGLDPNITLILADTNELQTDWTDGGRLDVILDAIKAMTDLIAINVTTVSDVNATDPNIITLTAGQDVNDAYWFNIIMIEDLTDNHKEVRYIDSWVDGRILEPDEPFGFTVAVGDKAWIMGTGYGGYLYRMWQRIYSNAPLYYFDDRTSGAVPIYYSDDRE